MKYILTISFICLSFLGLKAQINLTGRVVQGSKPLYNVSVVNKSKLAGTVTDVYGDFALAVLPGDLIQFSSIGYKTVDYKIPDTVSTTNFRILVSMVADTILLKEALVVPWPQNVTMLKEAMLDKNTEKERIAPYAGFREIEGDPVEPAPKPFSNPISFLYSKLSKKARQDKKMQKYRDILQEGEMYDPEIK